MRILIVEDDLTLGKLIKIALKINVILLIGSMTIANV